MASRLFLMMSAHDETGDALPAARSSTAFHQVSETYRPAGRRSSSFI